MRVLGVVQWTGQDKIGRPIAGVAPLFDIDNSNWRPVNALEEYPTTGQAFWFAARDATDGALVLFRPETNGDAKFALKVSEPHIVAEVLDLRKLGGPPDVQTALANGLRRTSFVPNARVYLWCAPDQLVGPVCLTRDNTGRLSWQAAHRDRLALYTNITCPRPVDDGAHKRLVWLDEAQAVPAGYVDWDEDRLVIRRAITLAVDHARHNGADLGLTKKLIDEAACELAADATTAETYLNQYRLERALTAFMNREHVAKLSAEVFKTIQSHPDVQTQFVELQETIRKDVEKVVRGELEGSLAAARRELGEIVAKKETIDGEVLTAQGELSRVNEELNKARAAMEDSLRATESELTTRLQKIVDKPEPFIAASTLLRSFLNVCRGGTREQSNGNSTVATLPFVWIPAATTLAGRPALQRALVDAFKSAGLSAVNATRIHAAVIAGLLPLIPGNSGVTALVAYSRAVCGSRSCILGINPSFSAPLDLVGRATSGSLVSHPTGLLAASSAAATLDVPSLLILEGINRAPIEAYLMPLLQLDQTHHGNQFVRGPYGTPDLPTSLRLAATTIAGPTALPVPNCLWAHSVAIDVEPGPEIAPKLGPADIPLNHEFFLPGDIPRDITDELIESWPIANDYRYSVERFAGGLARCETDKKQIQVALIECILLPVIATTMNEADRNEAFASVLSIVKHDNGPEVEQRLRRLEKRLRLYLG